MFEPEVVSEQFFIIHEDENYLIVDKPTGFVCTEKNFRGALHKKCFMVHRLDKKTSGIMILARTWAMKNKLEDLFLQRAIKKEYLAITSPFNSVSKFSIDKPLSFSRDGSKKTVYVCRHGLSARTDFQILSKSSSANLVLVKPITGRTHQIRVHIKSLGGYIIGDHQYQEKKSEDRVTPNMMLHAHKLAFSLGQDYKEYTCPMRPYFKKEMLFQQLAL